MTRLPEGEVETWATSQRASPIAAHTLNRRTTRTSSPIIATQNAPLSRSRFGGGCGGRGGEDDMIG